MSKDEIKIEETIEYKDMTKELIKCSVIIETDDGIMLVKRPLILSKVTQKYSEMSAQELDDEADEYNERIHQMLMPAIVRELLGNALKEKEKIESQ